MPLQLEGGTLSRPGQRLRRGQRSSGARWASPISTLAPVHVHTQVNGAGAVH